MQATSQRSPDQSFGRRTQAPASRDRNDGSCCVRECLRNLPIVAPCSNAVILGHLLVLPRPPAHSGRGAAAGCDGPPDRRDFLTHHRAKQARKGSASVDRKTRSSSRRSRRVSAPYTVLFVELDGRVRESTALSPAAHGVRLLAARNGYEANLGSLISLSYSYHQCLGRYR
jgi:hypothetical protein